MSLYKQMDEMMEVMLAEVTPRVSQKYWEMNGVQPEDFLTDAWTRKERMEWRFLDAEKALLKAKRASEQCEQFGEVMLG